MGGVKQRFPKPPRDSNLELLRIACMLMIVCHHMVVNSGVVEYFDICRPTSQQVFLHLWGMWGKTAINSFILISGYFLCKSTLSWQRVFKLIFQIEFYAWVILFICIATGIETLSRSLITETIIGIFRYVNNGFTSSFIAFYIFVPIYNVVIRNINRRTHMLMLCALLFYFTFASTFLKAGSMNEPFWYMTLYFLASYIRLHIDGRMHVCVNKLRWSIIFLVVGVVLAYSSVLFVDYYAYTYQVMSLNWADAYYCVSDSNKLFALWVGIGIFLTAKNLPRFHSKIINALASSAFGVLLIHSSNWAQRNWLWRDVCGIPELINAPMGRVVAVCVIAPLLIYVIAASIDLVRQRWIERPVMNWLYAKSKNIECWFVRVLEKYN